MSDPLVLQANANAREAAELLTHPNVSSVLVADGDKLVGCIGAENIVDMARRLGVTDGDRVRVVSRRGAIELEAHVVATIRPDTVFIPYHWPGKLSANRLTLRAYDPVAGIPEFKVAAVRIERVALEADAS